MTMIESLIAEDGIVVASDMWALIKKTDESVSNHIKQFELSSRCVLMATGNIILRFPSMMEQFARELTAIGEVDVSRVAMRSIHMLEESMQPEDSWLRGKSVMFFLVGYDLLRDGIWAPAQYALFKNQQDKWGIHRSKNDRIIVGGVSADEWTLRLDVEIRATEPSVNAYNTIARRAIAEAHVQTNGLVGDEAVIWNIIPGDRGGVIRMEDDIQT